MFNKKNKQAIQNQQQNETVEDMAVDFAATTPDSSDELDFDFDEDDSMQLDDEQLPEEDIQHDIEENMQEEDIEEEPIEEPIKEDTKQKKNDDKKLQDIVLHFVIDRSTSDMLDYFRGYGVNVSRIFNDIEEAKNEILMQINPCRIVIVDTGTGRFSLMGARKALIDLLGIGDEDNKISVFYTDSVIKEDISLAEEVDDKQIDWFKYRSTADILANLLQKSKKENYIIDDTLEEIEHKTTPEELMNFKGLSGKFEEMNLGLPSINVGEIAINREGGNQLQAYTPKY